jgi:hypothetical protein
LYAGDECIAPTRPIALYAGDECIAPTRPIVAFVSNGRAEARPSTSVFCLRFERAG